MESNHIELPLEIQNKISAAQAWHYRLVPKKEDTPGAMSFYISDQIHTSHILNELELLFGQTIILEKTDADVIERTLIKYYRKHSNEDGIKQLNAASVKNNEFLTLLISEAKELGSSDIHIETYEEKCRVRIRIDGKLIERYSIAIPDYPSLTNKIKIRANLDIAEKRLPQDGRIFFKNEKYRMDIRVSVLPTLHGEKIVLRLLSNDINKVDISKLGFNERQLEDYLEGIKKPHGIILISGPTGSGKTTTLYSTMKILNTEKTNIITIEDPVEYTLEGINQVQLKEDIGLGFTEALRSFLRQDPDIIMLGEIRDAQTAQMAIRAALTGHLVLSTIHTNSAWGTVSRLTDMGVPPFLVAGTLTTSVAQRLVRLLCNKCKKTEPFNKQALPKTFIPPTDLPEHAVPKGCEHCHYTGYKGRRAIYEVISIDAELAENIKNNAFDVEHLLKAKDIKTLKTAAFELLQKGETSIEEVYPILLNNY